MATAWLAAPGAAVVLFTGSTTRGYLPLVAVLWIPAAIGTAGVLAMKKTFGSKEQPAPPSRHPQHRGDGQPAERQTNKKISGR